MFENRSDIVRFLAVADAGGVGLAADNLEMTQPALSRVISRLERQFEGRLFERLPTGVRLTPFGVTVSELARPLLREFAVAEERLDAARSGRTGTFRVTAGPMWTDAVLPHAAARFHKSFPGIELKIETATRPEGLQRLAIGRSDLHCGGIDSGERLPAFLRRERFINITAGIVAHRNHPLLVGDVSYDDLAQCPWIDYDAPQLQANDPASPALGDLLSVVDDRTVSRVKTFVRTGTAGLLLMTRGPYLSWLPITFLERLPGLFLRPLPVAFGRYDYRTGFVARRAAEDLAPFRLFEDILIDAALGRRV